MATWKKLIVSGSNVSQLNNDAGYLTSVTAQTAFVTASVGNVHLIADNSEGQLNFNTGSSSTGVVISGSSGNDTISFSLSSIPNTSLANDGITIAGTDVSLGGSINPSAILNNTSVISGSAQIASDISGSLSAAHLNAKVANLVSSSGQIDGASITNNSVSFGGVSVSLNGSDGTPAFDLSDATAYPGDNDLVTVGTVTSGDVSAILPAGTVSGSITSPSQGTIAINGNNIDLGVQTSDSPQFTNLTVTGNLTVQGTTTEVQTTNLNVEDKFILLNSGSSTATDESGIIFGGANGSQGTGTALIWNGDYNSNDGRLAIANTVASDATTAAPNYFLAGVFTGSAAGAAAVQADHVGNIRVDSEDIYIYV